MPTGTGKGVVIALLLQMIFKFFPNQKVLIVTHSQELIQQNYEKLINNWPFAPAGINSAALKKRDRTPPIIFCGIGSIYKNPQQFGKVDIVLIDECHLVSPKDQTMYFTFLTSLWQINNFIKIVGLTATPWRLGQGTLLDPYEDKKSGKKLPSIFSDFCFDITGMEWFNRLINEGFLSPLIPKRTDTTIDVSGVGKRGGEFIESELQEASNKEEITRAAVEETLDCAQERNHKLFFCSGVDHCIATSNMFERYGIRSVAIHSKMTPADRKKGLEGFRSGYYEVCTNNGILTTGFDFAAIDFIGCLRPTMSAPLWVQMLGRGTRPLYAPGYTLTDFDQRMKALELGGKENCLVYDFAHNSKRLGPINDPVTPKAKGKGTGDAPVKVCPICNSFVHATLRFCNGILKDGSPCRNEFHIQVKIKQEASTVDLIKRDLPVVETFKIDHITYSTHKKVNAPPSLKVVYYCGLRYFMEFVCLEHSGSIRGLASKWWRERMKGEIPNTIIEAVELAPMLKVPSSINVWINKKYPQIMMYIWEGDMPTCDAVQPTTVEEHIERDGCTDDIPF